MNRLISKYFFYYPVTTIKGEWVAQYLREYTRNQFLSRDEIEAQQLNALHRLLRYACEKSPFYRKLYGGRDAVHAIHCLDDLASLPSMTKQDILDHQPDISAGLAQFRVAVKTTGGSSGHPVTILKNVDALARERAATWRSYAWAGVSVGASQARFWGVPLTTKNRLKCKLIDLVANRIRLSAFDISDDSLRHYAAEINRFQPSYLYGYVSMIDLFGQYMNDKGLRLPASVRSIITTSEVLTGPIRSRVENNLQRKVFNEYGCGEVGSIAHECQCGSMHIMSDNLIVEINDSGEIVVTDLHNFAMPLIRYHLNDFGTMSKTECQCGCSFPVLKKIYGRAYDMIKLADGTLAHPEMVMYVFEELKEHCKGLLQFQFVQQAVDKALINLVVSPRFDKNIVEKQLVIRLEHVLGTRLSVQFNYKDEIEREASGKIRLVKCNVCI